VPVEAIIFLFFILVLAPVVAVLAYCGIKGTCGQDEEENKSSH
jgi:nitrate reductase NapE component